MKLTTEELNEIVACHTTQPTQRGFIAYLGGHQFISSNRKKVFSQKNNISLSLRVNLEDHIKGIIRRHLSERGIPSTEIYRHPDYRDAWKNFLEQAEEIDFLKIVELT